MILLISSSIVTRYRSRIKFLCLFASVLWARFIPSQTPASEEAPIIIPS
jgi:hypothetical protein